MSRECNNENIKQNTQIAQGTDSDFTLWWFLTFESGIFKITISRQYGSYGQKFWVQND